MNWKEYEQKVFEELSLHYSNDSIQKNIYISGRFSQRKRQIDIYIRQVLNNRDYITIVDVKSYNKKVDIKIVESFISMIEDVDADYGILITELGYTKSALRRAAFNPKGIDLDIFDFREITHHLQGEGALTYAEDNLVLIQAPFGWIIDAKKRDTAICYLFKKGLCLEEAISGGEFAYVNFWNLHNGNFTINELANFQENNLKKHRQLLNIDYQPFTNILGYESMIRTIYFEDHPLIEITGFIRFDTFIFFCVCNTKNDFLRRNLRKMHILLNQTLPAKIRKE